MPIFHRIQIDGHQLRILGHLAHGGMRNIAHRFFEMLDAIGRHLDKETAVRFSSAVGNPPGNSAAWAGSIVCGTSSRNSRAPSPPANAISAAAAASPPSLKSWHDRTRPLWMAL